MKRCFKCKQYKPRSQFYKHSEMADGLLGKCKSCAKRDVAERVRRLSNNPEWIAAERERCRNKQAAYRAAGLVKPDQQAKIRWRRKNLVKSRASAAACRAVKQGKLKAKESCERCGANGVRLEKHHEDYSKPLEVVFLCCKCHGLTKRKDNK